MTFWSICLVLFLLMQAVGLMIEVTPQQARQNLYDWWVIIKRPFQRGRHK